MPGSGRVRGRSRGGSHGNDDETGNANAHGNSEDFNASSLAASPRRGKQNTAAGGRNPIDTARADEVNAARTGESVT